MSEVGNPENEEIGRLITQNAIDFLKKSVNEFDNDPMFSIIHFASSIELFLKARLALEHWTLVAEKIDDGSFEYKKLLAGEAKTVSAENVRKRIKIIFHKHTEGEAEIKAKAFSHFEKLARYRNKIIHFAMPENAHTEIAELQCKSWYYLYSILKTQWLHVFKVIFPDFEYQLNDLNQLMQKQRTYLAVKYEEIKPIIEKLKGERWTYSTCPSCGYDSFRHAFSSQALLAIVGRCEVCDGGERMMRCPKCKEEINLEGYEPGLYQCQKCSEEISENRIACFLGNSCGSFFDYQHGDVGSNIVWCQDCETETVANVFDTWFCTNCARVFDSEEIKNCEYCTSSIAGGKDETYYEGCILCDGKHGVIMSRDD